MTVENRSFVRGDTLLRALRLGILISLAIAGYVVSLPGCGQPPSQAGSEEPLGSTSEALGANYAIAKGATVAVAANQNGLLQAFSVDSNNNPITSQQTAIPTGWTAWATVGSNVQPILSHLAAARNSNGTIEVFGKSNDNAIWHSVQASANTNSWGAWGSLNGALASDPAVVLDGNNDLDVYALGWNDEHAWHIKQTSPGSWNSSGWSAVLSNGGTVRSNLAVVANANHIVHMFARGSDSYFYYAWQSSVGSWSGASWTSMPATGNSPMLWDPVACAEAPFFTAIDVYGVTANAKQNVLHTYVTTSTTEGKWDNLGGYLIDQLGCPSLPGPTLSPPHRRFCAGWEQDALRE